MDEPEGTFKGFTKGNERWSFPKMLSKMCANGYGE